MPSRGSVIVAFRVPPAGFVGAQLEGSHKFAPLVKNGADRRVADDEHFRSMGQSQL
jgi:hypothetical protein